MARPTAPLEKTIRTSVMLPESAHQRVQALATANHVSTAWVIRMAVSKFLRGDQIESLFVVEKPSDEEVK